MSIGSNLKKIFFVALWCMAAVAVLGLLVAAINRKNSRTCTAYKIEINGNGRPLFIDQKQVLKCLDAASEKIAGRTVASFDLRKMEDKLRKDVWIKDAQLFFDNNQVLRINLTEKEPIARIFTTRGNSFYIDSSCTQLPLPDKAALRLPVFTNFPYERIKLRGSDSSLADQIRKLGWYILKDPFWMADIEQVNITPAKTFELVPMIGNHYVEFGDGHDYEQKFHRLFVFYREVLSKTGFDKYSKIDVEWAGQVVGTRKGSAISRADSLQAARNILQLIKSASRLQADTVRQASKPLEHNTVTEQTLTNYDLVTDEEDSVKKKK